MPQMDGLEATKTIRAIEAAAAAEAAATASSCQEAIMSAAALAAGYTPQLRRVPIVGVSACTEQEQLKSTALQGVPIDPATGGTPPHTHSLTFSHDLPDWLAKFMYIAKKIDTIIILWLSYRGTLAGCGHGPISAEACEQGQAAGSPGRYHGSRGLAEPRVQHPWANPRQPCGRPLLQRFRLHARRHRHQGVWTALTKRRVVRSGLPSQCVSW